MKRYRRGRRIAFAATATMLAMLLTARIASQELFAAQNAATSSTADQVRFEKLVTKINWPIGRDGTGKSLFAYGPDAKNPTRSHSSEIVWWSVDLTKVAAVDVAINGKRVSNPRDARQAHTAIYRLGGQAIPGYRGGEGYFRWAIWPSGNFKFDFTVYDDAGNIIATKSHTIAVAPMPADPQIGSNKLRRCNRRRI